MIFGSKGRLRNRPPLDARRWFDALLLALFFALGLQAPSAVGQTAATFELDALLALIGKPQASRATFDERKFLRQLEAPVDSSGELLFQPPATLVMQTLQPRTETMRVDGQTLTLERGRLQRTLRLAEHPEIAVYVEPIRAALAGDRLALERGYSTDLRGTAADWKLRLTPKPGAPGAAPLAVESLLLSGRQGEVRQVEVRLADGDYSVMNIEPVAAR